MSYNFCPSCAQALPAPLQTGRQVCTKCGWISTAPATNLMPPAKTTSKKPMGRGLLTPAPKILVYTVLGIVGLIFFNTVSQAIYVSVQRSSEPPYEYHPTATYTPPAASQPPACSSGDDPFTVSATCLRRAFSVNQVAANQQYVGKTVTIFGEVASIGQSGTEGRLSLGDGFSGVVCHMPEEETYSLAELHTGQQVTLIGRVYGFSVGDVQVERCTLL